MRLQIASCIAGTMLLSPYAGAQQSVTPEPIVEVTADPPRVVVGQQITLRIVALAPNYMTSPPELPGFQVRNAVTRQLQSVNTSEQRDGVSYAGVRFEYAISPQEPGAYAITDRTINIKYAAEPPVSREVRIPLPRVSFEAFIPEAAAGLRPFVSADRLVAEQTIKHSPDPLKAGDAVTRTVTMTADGTPAILLPPLEFAAVDGLRLYPAQPSLEDKTDGRSDIMTATRIDAATYMLERPGAYLLPAIGIDWWNNASGKVERTELDAVPLAVAAVQGAADQMPTGRSGPAWTWSAVRDVLADHWLVVLFAAFVAAGIGLIAPRLVKRVIAGHRRRNAAYRQSETFAFNRLCRALSRDDARRAYFALLGWLSRRTAAPENTTVAFRTAAGDPVLDRQIRTLEVALFGSGPSSPPWSARRMLHHLVGARRHLRPRKRRTNAKSLPQNINPVGTSSVPAYGRRRPAR